jgi:putative MATE family efflux protein
MAEKIQMKNKMESSHRIVMIETPVPKLLARMSLPMMIAMTVNGLYYLVDAAFVGHAVGIHGVAALAVGFPIDMFFVSLALMCAVGTAAILSVKLGKGEYREAGAALKSVILFIAGGSGILTLITFLGKDHLLYMLGANADIYPHANSYYSVIIPGMIWVFLSFLGTNSVRAEGNAKFAAIGMITGALLNIVLDAMFILGWHWGTAGAAWGTVIARTVTVLLYCWYYLSNTAMVVIKTRKWKMHFAEIGVMLKIGFGAFLNQVGFSFLAAIVNLSIKWYGNPLDLSVFGLISRILIFITMPLSGIGQGVQVIVGFNYGAGHLKRVKQAVQTGYVFTFVFGALLFIVLFFFPQGILSLFTKSPVLIDAATEPLRISTWLVSLIGIQIVTYFYYIAVHHALNSIMTSICRQMIFITPFLLILPYFYSMKGVWLSFPLSDVISAAACFLLFRISFK